MFNSHICHYFHSCLFDILRISNYFRDNLSLQFLWVTNNLALALMLQLVRWYSESDMITDVPEMETKYTDNPVTPVDMSSHSHQTQLFFSYHTPSRLPVSLCTLFCKQLDKSLLASYIYHFPCVEQDGACIFFPQNFCRHIFTGSIIKDAAPVIKTFVTECKFLGLESNLCKMKSHKRFMFALDPPQVNGNTVKDDS